MRWWIATGNNLYFEVCLFYMEFEISFHLCSIFYGSITNYMASRYKITSCTYLYISWTFKKGYIKNQFLNVKVNIITASFDANKWQHLWFGRNNFNILTTHTLCNQIHLMLQWQTQNFCTIVGKPATHHWIYTFATCCHYETNL